MNDYQTNKLAAPVHTAPLFASCWLALFNELKGSFYAAPELEDLNDSMAVINDEVAKPAGQSAIRP